MVGLVFLLEHCAQVRANFLKNGPHPLAQTCCPCATLYLRMMGVDRGLDGGCCGYGAAFRRRGGRLRMHWRHEQLSIRLAVESALHHNVQRPHRPLIDGAVQTCTWTDMFNR